MTILDALTTAQFVWLIVGLWAGVCVVAHGVGKWIGRRYRRRAVRRIARARLETYCDPATPLEARHAVPAFLREPHVRLRVATGGSGSVGSVAPGVSSGDESGYQTTGLIAFPGKRREMGQ